MRKRFGILLAACLLCGLLAGCGSTNGKDHTIWVTEESAPESGYLGDVDAADADTQPATVTAQKLIKGLDIEMETTAFDAALPAIRSAVAECGGYVEGSSTHGTEDRFAEMVLRIPTEKLDVFTGRLPDCGEIISRAESVADVTAAYIDVESRIKALETEQATLLRLMAEAGNISDLLTVQDRLTDVRAELEKYKAQQRDYDSRIAYSRIELSLSEVQEIYPSAASRWERIGQDFMRNLRGIGNFFGDACVWLLGSSPVLLLFGILVLAVVLLVHFSVKRQRKKAAARSLQPPLSQDPPQPTKKD